MMSTSTAETPTRRRAARAGALAGAAALIGNLGVYVVALLAGVDFGVARPDGETFTVGLVPVVLFTVVPIALATGLLVLLCRRPVAWTALAWAGLAIGVLTVVMPLFTEAEVASRLALAAMHVVPGVAWFVALRRP